MWLLKQPILKTENMKYYTWAHHVELVGLISLIPIVLYIVLARNLLVTVSLLLIPAITLLISDLIQFYVAIKKKESLRFSVLWLGVPFNLVLGGPLKHQFLKGNLAIVSTFISVILHLILVVLLLGVFINAYSYLKYIPY